MHGRARLWATALVAAAASLTFAAPAVAQEEILNAASYGDMTTYSCRTNAITIHPGQNLNRFGATKTCPNAEKLSGPGGTDAFAPGSSAEGYITRFKPSMVEIKDDGSLVTPSVWDLHLHHVVWINDGPVFASGEEKTNPKMPQGYGFRVGGDETWILNDMIHNLTAEGGRQVYLTWEIDWVPIPSPSAGSIRPVNIRWMDTAGLPHIYPVFDAERGFDLDGDGKYVFPDEVPTDPAAPGYEERENISPSGTWTVNRAQGVTLIFGAGHLHPGGLYVDLEVSRDLDASGVAGDAAGETKPLFRSEARYYEPAGAVSWDVSMEATRPEWRIQLKQGDVLKVNATYDVRKASWYESMGILPLAFWNTNAGGDPAARDPFDDAAEVQAMYDAGGILTHGRLPENIDKKAGKDLKLPDPRKLGSHGRRVPKAGLTIDGFRYSVGGYSAFRGFPQSYMYPPKVRRGRSITFTNLEALFGMPDDQQVWHSITSCKAPCNAGSGIGYPLAGGKLKFDSGQLGYGTGTSSEVTTGSNVYTTPPLKKRGKTYTYFCRIHPFMRGSVRVKGKKKRS